MAFRFPALALPMTWRRNTTETSKALPKPPFRMGALPVLGKLSVGVQLAILIGFLVGCLAIDAILVHLETQRSAYATMYIARSGQLRTLSQRLAKAAQLAALGNLTALSQLRESRDEFSQTVKLLTDGGLVGDVVLPPTSSYVRGTLDQLAYEWARSEKNATYVVNEEQSLLGLGAAVRSINGRNSTLSDLTEEVVALINSSPAAPRQSFVAGELMVLTQRIAKNANIMLGSDTVDPEVAFLLSKDTNTFRDNLQGLLKGRENPHIPAVTNPEVRAKLGELEVAFGEYLRSVTDILGNAQPLVKAKQAARDLFLASDSLLIASEILVGTYQDEQRERTGYLWLILFSTLAFLTLLLIIKVYMADSRKRVGDSERQNRTNQDAILRLLDEIGELAQGDLTVRARVTEDVTGAIADSINATIDELRRLVTGITTAANQVTTATGEAQKVTGHLLQAAQKQSTEIQGTSQAVTRITQSINEVSANATESARVAENSLIAAGKGAEAVQNAIRGMNDIREQIQETAKRIKRLGESSQEIGEIVQLISDITEQTNVLALNAAIQAASAGEAGRGFTVVAEEVQRLAERSAEATKHISAIVRSIQADTQDTVTAMERSTQGVVEGTRVADMAGQALQEIGAVSKQLATLIASISHSTTSQAEAAIQVAARMKDILSITNLTADGTKKTAASTQQLATLAQDLKSSVAGFKLA